MAELMFSVTMLLALISAIFSLPTSDIAKERDTVLRVYNGDKVDIEKYPYYVNLPCGCGGSIIDRRWILTAAHCPDAPLVYVACDSAPCHTEGNSYRVKTIFRHPLFNTTAGSHDIALIKLERSLKLSSNVQIIPLANEEDYRDRAPATLVGMGEYNMPFQTNDNKDPIHYLSKYLRKGSVKILFRDSCVNLLKNIKYHDEKLILPDDVICAYPQNEHKRQESCFGDSGGPLVSGGKQVGIVSRGFTTWCTPALPVLFTKVTYFNDWIHKITGL